MRILIATVSVAVLVLVGCGPSEKEIAMEKAGERVDSVVAAARNHFGSKVDAGNWGTWTVTSVRGKVSEFEPYPVVVYVEMGVPASMAKKIMSMSTDLQYKAVGWNACPPRRDRLWAALDSEDRIVAQPTISGAVFADVDCRREGM